MKRKDPAAVETFGARLHRMRKARGFTLAELATEAGATKGYLSQLENEIETNPSARVLSGLADALKVSVDWMLGRAA